MDRRAIIPLIIGFMLGVFQWLGDRIYGFGGYQITGMFDLILKILPFINSVCFLEIAYWSARLVPFVILIVLICIFSLRRGDKKKRDEELPQKIADALLPGLAEAFVEGCKKIKEEENGKESKDTKETKKNCKA